MNVTHIGGITYLLYLLPLVLGVLSLIAIYKGEIRYAKVWMIDVSVLGLCLCGLAVSLGKGQIEYMANAFGNMNTMFNGFSGGGNAIAEQHQAVKASMGLGGILMIIGFPEYFLGIDFSGSTDLITVTPCKCSANGTNF